MKELKKEIVRHIGVISEHMDELTSRMKFYDGRIMELTSLISNTAVVNKPVSNNKTNDSNVEISNGLIDSLESIKNLIVLDPYKAKIELENLILSIKKD